MDSALPLFFAHLAERWWQETCRQERLEFFLEPQTTSANGTTTATETGRDGMKIKLPQLPKIEYVNIRKTFPSIPEFQQGLYFRRFWAGDLIHLGYQHHHFVIDMRKGVVQDLMGKIESDH